MLRLERVMANIYNKDYGTTHCICGFPVLYHYASKATSHRPVPISAYSKLDSLEQRAVKQGIGLENYHFDNPDVNTQIPDRRAAIEHTIRKKAT